MTEIIFFDIDGTLRDEALGIPKSVEKAFFQCRKTGYRLVICTGRSMGTIQEDVLSLGADGYITGGGCRIQYGDTVIKDMIFPADMIQTVLRALTKRTDTGFTMESGEAVFMNSRAAALLEKRNREVGIRSQGGNIIYQDNIKALDAGKNRIHKICLWGSSRDFLDTKEMLKGEMELVQTSVWGKYHYYELIPKGCQKGGAIRELCGYLNIPLSRTMSFGDGKNDIEMLKATRISAAMENGDKELFPYADLICREPMKDGIYWALVETGVIPGEEAGTGK
ncbi:Cof-type HAD-IIB family hydrolase [Clostridium sp. MCC353]|uniref:Cof-type HAD-IIB family hydrolase n=1 Tax=Clostridium sp. MCC353 TaxID=2592646 RepID=UPI001C01DC08|nr:HAD family hydrolase [Clostridium sp. MCC353]MBT9776434.1 Cof-type HAD-IIB family hydrolase [Clostridium sp. MCC353]